LKIVIRWRPLALSGIALLGLALRLYGLDWDSLASRFQYLLRVYGPAYAYGNNFHPDERQIMFHVVQLAWPNSWAQFFDAANSPLNPHFFAYGSFPLYLLASIGNILSHFSPTLVNFANLTLTGRALNAVFDTGTILLTGGLALLLIPDRTPGRRYAWSAALLAAALVAFTPFQIQQSHFYTVDTMLLFFVTLTIFACVKLVDTGKPVRWSLIVGLGYGLALATKFSAAPLIVPLLVALALRWYKSGFSSIIAATFLSLVSTALIFLIAMPYALLDHTNFVQQIAYQGDLARGLVDVPYEIQFAGTTPYVYELQNMVIWGLGVALGVAALAALIWLCWRVWKRDAGSWLIVLSWVIVYGAITGSFYAKFMRYMLPIYPFLTLMAAAGLLALWCWLKKRDWHIKQVPLTVLAYGAIAIVLAGTIFQGLALLNVYSQPNTRIQASLWIYSHIKPGSVLTYEQWDDSLPVAVDGHNPSIYQQATYPDPDANGQPVQGLDLYGADTIQKAQALAKLLPTIDAITMPTDRLDKSIPRLPARYPLTIHYYQLLFSGQLGFHLAAQFEVRPNLLGITLDDSGADESYSVFDHPTARIFVRDNPYPYTSAQLLQKLLDGVQLPASDAGIGGSQRSLLLSAQQIDDDQQSPSFGSQFPQHSPSNTYPVFFWWLALALLGVLAYPLTFPALRGLTDRGYIFSKTLGLLLLAYIAWMLANLHLIAFSHLSMLVVCLSLLFLALVLYWWQRKAITRFIRQRWRLLLIEEGIFTLAFLAFVAIRSFNPDLWNPLFGGEKPMELAFLNAVLRSPYMPPYDPWFSGGYINYYYYGYVIFGALIKLTGIVPTTAFNLAIPTLFALTFTGVVTVVYSFTRRFSLALLGGYFAALIGNFDGVLQLKQQFAALLSHMQPAAFNYWQSSRIIPFTINEFPFWSFLFADLHPHVIDLPIATFMLGIVATLLLFDKPTGVVTGETLNRNIAKCMLYGLAAFIFGTIACVNPWDMPVYALLLAVVLLLRTIQVKRGMGKLELSISLAFTPVIFAFVAIGGYLLYWPFYAWYQELYVNGPGLVNQGTSLGDYLTISGLWIFLTLSFFLLELYLWWSRARASRSGDVVIGGSQCKPFPAGQRAGYLLLCGIVLTFAAVLGLKVVLLLLIALGAFLFVMQIGRGGGSGEEGLGPLWPPAAASNRKSFEIRGFDFQPQYTYLLLLMALCIGLGVEIVYIRDFLDGSDYERMNTVFKFSMQAWLCFAVAGALVVQRLWNCLRGFLKQAWLLIFALLLLGSSVFLPLGTLSRIDDHQAWAAASPPAQSAAYTPTLDGFAFARSWYPGDAQAISWLNENITGSPVILEAAAPVSYAWFNRVSVYTGLPDVLGWVDHEDEQRYNNQALNRMTDIGIIYTTPDPAQALELLYYYHVRYIYVGELEREAYAQQSTAGLDKFDAMVGSSLRLVYRSNGVTIYEVM
jgi:YYY domain-containing protein